MVLELKSVMIESILYRKLVLNDLHLLWQNYCNLVNQSMLHFPFEKLKILVTDTGNFGKAFQLILEIITEMLNF